MTNLLIAGWPYLLLAAALGALFMSRVSRRRALHLQKEFELLWKRWKEETDTKTSKLYSELSTAESKIQSLEAQLRKLNAQTAAEQPQGRSAHV